MNKQLEWKLYDSYNKIIEYARYRKCQLHEMITGKGYWAMPKVVAGKVLLSTPKTNAMIAEAIEKQIPFWAGRFGGTEMNAIYQYLAYDMDNSKDMRENAIERLCHYSGFFPKDVSLGEQFVQMMLHDCKEIDLQGEWRRYMEDYIYVKYQKNTTLTQLHHIEPWEMYRYSHSGVKPWTSALKGKKVLVIHPFEESIRRQYDTNRKNIFSKIFPCEDILPEFELITLKAVQTLGGEADPRFETWFEALDWMKEECKKIEFDVAIIGCGAYGYPLAAEIKRMGKIAIHLAGATQLLFGIIGKRWEEEYPDFARDIVNEYWVRPSEGERIKKSESIESNCYW